MDEGSTSCAGASVRCRTYPVICSIEDKTGTRLPLAHIKEKGPSRVLFHLAVRGLLTSCCHPCVRDCRERRRARRSSGTGCPDSSCLDRSSPVRCRRLDCTSA